MRVFVTGASGQLGYDVAELLKAKRMEYMAVSRGSMDITDKLQVRRVIKDYKPDCVIHCAAYTSVDNAENDRDNCYKVNVLGTRYIADVCRELNAKMVYISTDYVFDGESNEPYSIEDVPNPINYYGLTKYQGELEVQQSLEKYYIVRTSWVFGENGNNFVKTMLGLGMSKKKISVVADQVGSPTYTHDLAKILIDLIKTEGYGVHHISNSGYCTWYEFAEEIFKQSGLNIKLIPVYTSDYPSKVLRPKNSRFHRTRLLPDWKDALSRFMITR